MEGLIVILVLIGLGVAGFAWFQRTRSSPIGQRAETLWRSEHPGQQAAPAAREPTVDTLRPGDAITFWDGEDSIVDTVLQCEEQLGTRRTQWRWNLLRGGRMLETAPDDNVLYAPGEVHHQGSAVFDQLTKRPGGVLDVFEMKVREGTSGLSPTYFEYQGRQFRMASTGTFTANALGAAPAAEVWRDLSAEARDNVYFELEAEDGTQGLGIWTTHILMLVGEPLKTSDVRAIYPGQGAPV